MPGNAQKPFLQLQGPDDIQPSENWRSTTLWLARPFQRRLMRSIQTGTHGWIDTGRNLMRMEPEKEFDETLLADAKHPWHRQFIVRDGKRIYESAKAHQAFRAYAEMGDSRSLRKVAAQLHKSTTLIGRWSTTWRWPERTPGHLQCGVFEHFLQMKYGAAPTKVVYRECETFSSANLTLPDYGRLARHSGTVRN